MVLSTVSYICHNSRAKLLQLWNITMENRKWLKSERFTAQEWGTKVKIEKPTCYYTLQLLGAAWHLCKRYQERETLG